ncbi:MAG: FkbM family methyltransferase [Acidimicrobiales bacterium]
MDIPFFPNLSPEAMAFEREFRRHIEPLSADSRLSLYEMVTNVHPELVATRFELEDRVVVAHQLGAALAFPRPLPLIKHAHLACGYETWLARKYALPGFVEVEANDVVIDCGAYVGGFSLSAARVAAEVHLFEPDALNHQCVERNVSSNVRVNRMGLYDVDETVILNVSESSVEHSILVPDDGEILRQEPVRVVRLDTYCSEHGIRALDFVKIEAEGVELEAVAGLGSVRPKKFAIDVSPERDGESPAAEFTDLLIGRGYEVRQRAHVLFARL